MADSIERTIYKLELDSSGYINGVEAVSASTKRLTDAQERANKALQTNEAALKNNTANLAKTKKDLDDYTGANERYRKQLEKSLKDASANQIKLTQLVAENRKEYERAETAAKNFANVSARATTLQQGTTGGKIPTGPVPGLRSPIQAIEGMPQNIREFDQLAVAIGIAEVRMNGLNEEDEEFKLLAPIVAKGREALKLYADTAEQAGGKTLSLRSQLRLGREELVKLEQAGLGATKQYFELEKRVARLTDEFQDQQQRIKILASDTKLLDFGKGAITAATSAFQTYASISILAGDESAELQKKTMQLFAAMQLLQSLEQLSNLTRREGVLATLAQSGAQSVYTAVVGASTGALKAFRLALLATGIGAAVVGIGLLVVALNRRNKALKEAGENQKLLNEITEEGNKEAGKQIADLKVLYTAATNVNVPMKERLKAVKDLQKEFPAFFGNIKTEIILNGDAKKSYDDLTLSIIANARSVAAKAKIDAIETQRLDIDFKKQQIRDEAKAKRDAVKKRDQKDLTFEVTDAASATGDLTPEQQQQLINQRERNAIADQDNKDAALVRQEDFLLKFVKLPEKVDKTTGGTGAGAKKVENIFAQTLNELLERLRVAGRKSVETIDFIQQPFIDKLIEEVKNIDKLVDEGKLSKDEGGFLVKILQKIIGKESDAAVQLLKDRIVDAIDKLNRELEDIESKAALGKINLIEDEFKKRAALIDFNEKEDIENAEQFTIDRLAALDFDRLLIGEENYQRARKVIITNGDIEVMNIIAKSAQDRQKLSAEILKDAMDAVEAETTAGLTEGVKEGETKPPTERFQDYAVAIGELTQSIISFWQKANEAESAALDRSIALQEKRVEAAQRIAARGNAQYLKQEEDRLKAMQVQKENAARRELAINAALQASQLLVGITGAISKIATPGIGIAETIGAIAVIFASLATGYGLVKSLQGSQPKLAAGTKSVRRNGHPSGTDTIPALLNEGEAVIPTHRNRAYHPAVAAIYDGTIPAEDMNRFVSNYHRVKGVPRPDFNRIKDAAELSIGYDGRLLEELKENNNLQRQTLRAMKNMSVSANIDRNGVAIMVNEFMIQQEIDKRV